MSPIVLNSAIYTSLGEISYDNGKVIFTNGRQYVFDVGNYLSDEEVADIYANRAWKVEFMLR